MRNYPTVNFIGNKRQLIPWIVEQFPIRTGSVLDIFSGGGSVSYAFKDMGLQVLSNDYLYSNYILSKAFVENDSVYLSKDVFDTEVDESELDNVISNLQFLSSRLYFDYEIPELARLVAIAYTLDDYDKYLFLSLIRRAMIRKLPYSRMNIGWEKIVQLRDEDYSYRMYGRKRAYHNEPFINHMKAEIDNYNNAVFSNGHVCKSYNVDAMEMARSLDYVDAVYMDPPYPSTLNNYVAFYGLFDEMFGLKTSNCTDFVSKKTFCKNMSKLLDVLKDKTKHIVLSINTRVTPPFDEIIDLFSQYGHSNTYSKDHNYQLTSKENKQSSKELLIVVDL